MRRCRWVRSFRRRGSQLGLDQPGFADPLDLIKAVRGLSKISGAYRASTQGPDYLDVAPLAKALIAANRSGSSGAPTRPHPDLVTPPGKKPTDVTPLYQIDDGRLLNQLAMWAPRRRHSQDNPGRQPGAALRLLTAGVTSPPSLSRKSSGSAELSSLPEVCPDRDGRSRSPMLSNLQVLRGVAALVWCSSTPATSSRAIGTSNSSGSPPSSSSPASSCVSSPGRVMTIFSPSAWSGSHRSYMAVHSRASCP